MPNPTNSDALGTSHKSCAQHVFKSQTINDHSQDIAGQVVYDGSPISIERLDNQADDNTDDTIVYDNTPAATVSPTTVTKAGVVATHNSPTQTTMHTKSTSKRTLQKHITPNKRLTGYNWSNDNGTKAPLEEATVQEVVPKSASLNKKKEARKKKKPTPNGLTCPHCTKGLSNHQSIDVGS